MIKPDPLIINIISTQIYRTRITGPKKVLENTCKGLDKLGITYIFNQPISDYTYNWIHDDQKAIIEAGFVKKPVLIGPNTAVLPKDLPIFRFKLPKKSIYIHPSQWVLNTWRLLGYDEAKLESWPVGIDLNAFKSIDRNEKRKVLLYFKQRDLKILAEIKLLLQILHFDYTVIYYGFYKEDEYLQVLNECQFGIWIGCSESQGIGLQEALATNLPLIVLDAVSIFDTIPTNSKKYFGYNFPSSIKNIKTTTVPYFDARCGIKIEKITDLEESLLYMFNNIHEYKPREYIQENLSLEKCTTHILSFFDQMNIQESNGYNYQRLSKILYYCGLIFQIWAWKWLWRRIIIETTIVKTIKK